MPMFCHYRVCVAPMLNCTDRHYRYLLRQISRHSYLYTEMLMSSALLHGNSHRYLAFTPLERPLALQLGGSDPQALARCARLAQRYGYDEINLNVGCPSVRVLAGRFGACLMQTPQRVADCVKAMRDAVNIAVTVKHRTGLGWQNDYARLSDFVFYLKNAGCERIIVHARNAILQGLSPKQNRQIPPLRYDDVYRLAKDFPDLTVILNGGITTWEAADEHLEHVQGVMLGRMAYNDPYAYAQVDHRYYGDTRRVPSRAEIVALMLPYIYHELAQHTPLSVLLRPLLGLYQGQPGARLWRRLLSTQANDATILTSALAQIEAIT